MKLNYVDPQKCDFTDPTNGVLGRPEIIIPTDKAQGMSKLGINTIDIAYLAEASLERIHLWTGTTFSPNGRDSGQQRIEDSPYIPQNLDSLNRCFDKTKIRNLVYALNICRDSYWSNEGRWLTQGLSESPKRWGVENVYRDYVASKLLQGDIDIGLDAYHHVMLLANIYNGENGLYDELRKMSMPILQIAPFDYHSATFETTDPITKGTGTIPSSTPSFCEYRLNYRYQDFVGSITENGYSYWRAGVPLGSSVNPDCRVPVGGSKPKSSNMTMWGIIDLEYSSLIWDYTQSPPSHQSTSKLGSFLVNLNGIYQPQAYSGAVNFWYQLGMDKGKGLLESLAKAAGGVDLRNVNQIAAAKVSDDCIYNTSLTGYLTHVFVTGEMSGNSKWW